MASVASFVLATPRPGTTSPLLPQRQTTSAPSTAGVAKQPAHVKHQTVDVSLTQLRTSRTLSFSPLTATTPSMETTTRSRREMQEIRQCRMNMMDPFGRKKRRFTAPKTIAPSETKPNKFKHRDRPSLPLAPRISRLPTPDLSDLEADEFCTCCDANESGREMGSDDRQRKGRTSTISYRKSGQH